MQGAERKNKDETKSVERRMLKFMKEQSGKGRGLHDHIKVMATSFNHIKGMERASPLC